MLIKVPWFQDTVFFNVTQKEFSILLLCYRTQSMASTCKNIWARTHNILNYSSYLPQLLFPIVSSSNPVIFLYISWLYSLLSIPFAAVLVQVLIIVHLDHGKHPSKLISSSLASLLLVQWFSNITIIREGF